MPKIKDIKKHLIDTIEEIKSSTDIESLYVWGSFADNYENPNFRIRDIDVIATTNFHSEDLIAVDEEILTQKIANDELENLGYNPSVIKFSKNFLKSQKYKIDHWVISSDNKLLHWGPTPSSKEESDDINKEASNHAFNITGYEREKIHKATQEVRDNWYEEHHSFLTQMFSNMPSGWYLSDTDNIKEVLEQSIQF